MPRYNTSLASNQISGAATIGSPYQGAFTELTGASGYTVNLPAPTLYPGSNLTFYNATSPAGAVTLSTPSGAFTGTGGPGTSTYNISAGNVISVTSDGTNYIVISEDGSPLTATTGSFSGSVTINGSGAILSVTPQTVTIAPTGSSTIDNVNIGVTTRGSGAFNTLTSNAATTFTAGTASSSTSTGTLVVTGGVGVSGTLYAGALNGPLTGTLQTAAQPNITSVGNLTTTGLTVNGSSTHNGTTTTSYGAVTASNQIYYPLRLSPASGTGGYGANGQGIKFDVWSNAGISTGAAIYSSMGSGGGGGNDFSSSLVFATKKSSDSAPVEALRIDDSNQVGIGTTASSSKLHIYGTHISGHSIVKIQTATTTDPATLGFFNSGGSRTGIIYYSPSGTNIGVNIETQSGDPVIFNPGGTELGRFLSNGNVGFGTKDFSAGYAFNVAKTARFNGMMLGNSDGSNTADNRLALNWSSGTDAYVYAQQNVPFKIGQNNTERFRVTDTYAYALPNRWVQGAEYETASVSGGTTISGSGYKELFRMSQSRLVTAGMFSISATRGNYVHGSTWAWTSSHAGGSYGTLTQLSSTNYTQASVALDIESAGGVIISVDWGLGYTASFPMDYTVTVTKFSGGSSADFSSAGTDRSSPASGYSRRRAVTSNANGFQAENAYFASLSKGSGTFKIDHPLPELESTTSLVHSFIEGPKADLIYRGEVTLVAGQAEVNIDEAGTMTEGTFEALCRSVQCFTSNETDWSAVKGRVTGNILTIECQDATSTATVSWLVIGERKDKHMVGLDWTDEQGRVRVELPKENNQSYPEYPENVTVNSPPDTAE